MDINICFVCTNNEIQNLAVTITSVLLSSSLLDNYTIYVIESSMSYMNKKKLYILRDIRNFNLIFIKISEKNLTDFISTKKIKGMSLNACLIFKIPSLLSDVDKIIYLDSCMVINEDISELYNTNIDNYYAAAIPEVDFYKHKSRLNILGDNYYVKTSVFLINCKNWKKYNLEKQLFKYIQNPAHNIVFFIQDVLNDVLKYKIRYLPKNLNCDFIKIENKFSEEYIKYLAYTPFKLNLVIFSFKYLFYRLRDFFISKINISSQKKSLQSYKYEYNGDTSLKCNCKYSDLYKTTTIR